MPGPSHDRDIGQLQAQMQAVSAELRNTREGMAEMRETLAELRLLVAHINGGSRVLLWLLGGAATLGGLIVSATKLIWYER